MANKLKRCKNIRKFKNHNHRDPEDFSKKVVDIIKDMEKIIEEYGESAELEYVNNWDPYCCSSNSGIGHFDLYIYREETDKEYDIRCKKHEREKKRKEEIKRRKLDKERKEYERLKKKFEGKR